MPFRRRGRWRPRRRALRLPSLTARQRPLAITILEPKTRLGAGVAYSGAEPSHVTNAGGEHERRSGRPRQFAAAIAGGVIEALADPISWPVRDGAGVRRLRSGDVAILCRGNDDVAEVAAALSRCGVPVAVEMGSPFRDA